MCRCVVNEIRPFRVAGDDDAAMVEKSPMLELSSEPSLQLRLEKREHQVPLQTPSPMEGSEQTSSGCVLGDADAVEEASPQKGTRTPHAYPHNDLDEAIEEAQALKDLVSMGNFDHTDYALTVL